MGEFSLDGSLINTVRYIARKKKNRVYQNRCQVPSTENGTHHHIKTSSLNEVDETQT